MAQFFIFYSEVLMIILLLIFQIGNPYPYYDLIQKYADNYNLPPNLIAAIIKVESNFNPKASSHVNYK